MAAFKLIPMNLIITILVITTIYLLFEVIRRKDLLQKVFFLFLFYRRIKYFYYDFYKIKSLNIKIAEIGFTFAGITFLVGIIIVYIKGDSDDKLRVRDVVNGLVAILCMFLLIFLIGKIIY